MTVSPPWLDPGDFWFRRYLEVEIPELLGKDLSPFEKVQRLRGWVCRNTPRAPLGVGMHLSDDEALGYYGMSASNLYKAFGEYVGGAMCHDIAYALVKVYELFGFPAFIYNMGIENSLKTHAVTVVTIDESGSQMVVQDPYYNLTITRDDGTPVDFIEMLVLLNQRRHDVLRIGFDEDGEHDYIAPKDSTSELIALPDYYNMDTLLQLSDGRIGCRRFISLTQWVTHSKVETALEARGFPGNVLYLFCLPLGVFANGGSNTEESRKVLARINESLGNPFS